MIQIKNKTSTFYYGMAVKLSSLFVYKWKINFYFKVAVATPNFSLAFTEEKIIQINSQWYNSEKIVIFSVN